MPDTLLSVFPDPAEILAAEPEQLGAAIIELAPGIMQNGMFNLSTLVAPLYQIVGAGYPPGSQTDVRNAVAEALSVLTTKGLLFTDPGQPSTWYRLTRRAATLKDRAEIERFLEIGPSPRSPQPASSNKDFETNGAVQSFFVITPLNTANAR